MHCLLIYDIPNDRVRQKIADACLDYGLRRIQYSAFSGTLSRTHQRELMTEVKQRLGKNAGNIQLFTFPEDHWNARRIISQGENYE